MSKMSRGEMIRRLDDAAREVHDHLENGPLTAAERHALAASLSRLLPTVADTLQDLADEDAAKALIGHGDPTATTFARDQADVTSSAMPASARWHSARPGTRQDPRPPPATAPAFRAEKPVLTSHPVRGGDALMFTITPPPPQWWWRAMRHHAGASPALIRPWDQERDNRIAVECPSRDKLADVIAAIEAAVAQSNADYAGEVTLQRDAANRLRTDEVKRMRHLREIQQALDEHYDSRTSAG
jgi:hypothetical protein